MIQHRKTSHHVVRLAIKPQMGSYKDLRTVQDLYQLFIPLPIPIISYSQLQSVIGSNIHSMYCFILSVEVRIGLNVSAQNI